MDSSADRSQEESANEWRILTKDMFLYFLDLEVKRARRYQNFICVLLMELVPFSEKDDEQNFETCRQTLTKILKEARCPFFWS
jgi:hypothetical protein